MKIYQNHEIIDQSKANFPIGTMGYSYSVLSASLKLKEDSGEKVLKMELKDLSDEYGEVLKYSLSGESVYEPFMKDLRVKSIDDLVGKNVLVYIPKNNNSVRGLGVRK